MKVGYARVSTTGQKLAIQIAKLKSAGCEKIFKEKKSGVSAKNRKQLKEVLEYVRKGDTLYITKLDRLARSVSDLTQIVKNLGEKHTGFVVIDQDINTLTPTGKLVFHMISAIGEFERDLIVERTTEGKEIARQKGVKFGRKPKLSKYKIEKLKDDVISGNVSKEVLAKKYSISKSSVYRIIKDLKI